MKQKNVKTISDPAESTDKISQNLKNNPLSGETVPLRKYFLATFLYEYIK